MHLVGDMSVPDHARNDAHLAGYELWALKNIKVTDDLSKYTPVFLDRSLLRDINPLARVPVANLFDTSQYRYDGRNPEVTLGIYELDKVRFSTVGLAEYTNANFFSDDTISDEDYPFPSLDDAPIKDDGIIDPRNPAGIVTRK